MVGELLLVTALAALTRLWALFSPRAVVFDEVHTLRFVQSYLAGTPYFDVHPPLAVQLFALTAKLLGVNPAGADAGAPVAMRVLPAVMATLLVPLVWLLVRRVGGSRRAAFLGAALIALDNAMVVQSRFMLPDVLLVAFGIAAVVVWLGARDSSAARGNASDAATPGRDPHWGPLLAAGALAGMATAVKWTGLSALGLILAFELLDGWRARPRWRTATARGALVAAAAVGTYLLVFAVHLHRFAGSGGFLSRFLHLHRAMLAGDRELESAQHLYASPWYSWPLLARPIHYWLAPADAAGRAADIYLVGNPLVWWGSTVAVLLFVVERARRRMTPAPGANLVAAGWAINFLPFAAIARLMYLYHYLHALVFAVALGAVWIGTQLGWFDGESTWRISRERRDVAFWGILAAAIVLFLFFAPVTYGWRLSPAALQLRLWLPGWG